MVEDSLFLFTVIAKWLLRRARGIFVPKISPVHILFCMVDHFEPHAGGVSVDIEKKRMDDLLSKYPDLANKHKDYHGNPAKRTWFFPPNCHRNGNLRQLVSLCERSYGEIELHLHHGKSIPDTSDNLEKTINKCIEEYAEFGIFGIENGRKRYGFIHGDWALDNSLGGKCCGVNNELDVLIKTGCYADFTLPAAVPKANPAKLNSIYYAKDDPDIPKSYNNGTSVAVHGAKNSGLMIIQGPSFPFFPPGRKIPVPRYESDMISNWYAVSRKRIDLWVKTGVHISGKREWVIIKVHTHGATEGEVVLGEEMDTILNHLETKYNDGTKFILHYVTSRELYNIIKAAEAGETGDDPEVYRDYAISPPQYDSTKNILEASNTLKYLSKKTMRKAESRENPR